MALSAANQKRNWAEQLKGAILDRTVKVCVIGLGYVGLPLAVEKAKVGFTVVGIDRNTARVSQVNRGLNYIGDVDGGELAELVDQKKLRATDDFEVVFQQDILIICVPTPLTPFREPDISYIENVVGEIAQRLRPGQLIILESTTYPGTTEEVILPKLQATGLQVGRDFFLAYSPERVDPGNQRYTTHNTSKVLGGVTSQCLDVARTLYQQTIIEVVAVSSPAVAEMSKVFENTYRAVNIALVNELMLLCDRMNINVWEVIDAASTKPFGIHTFYPGPGVGGHCIPVDPFYLSWKARQYDFSTRFIELAREINIQASYYVVTKVVEALNAREKAVKGSRIMVLGISYKKDVADFRESPALKIIKELERLGAEVVFFDPYVPVYGGCEAYTSAKRVELTEQELAHSDCVLIVTDHSNVDYQQVAATADIVVDARNATRNVKTGREKIVLI